MLLVRRMLCCDEPDYSFVACRGAAVSIYTALLAMCSAPDTFAMLT